MPAQDNISGKKYTPHGRSAKFTKFEYDDKAEHHSEFPSHGWIYWDSGEYLWS